MNYFEMYRDIWNYHKKYIDCIEDTDEFWQSFIDDGRQISRKYGGCKFIVNLVLAEITEFEQICKEMRVNAGI